MSSVVYQETSNNFTDANQTIKDRAIASVIYSPMTPTESKTDPSRVGEIYIQISEGTSDKKLRMWMSVAVTGNKFQWEEATGVTTPIPDTVARTDKVNDFQPWEQTISGNQIMSFVDGGDKNPGDSNLAADYDGQFYIAVKTLSGGAKDVGIWVAKGNQWLPIVKPEQDLTKFANKTESNTFSESQILGAPINLIGDPAHTRMIAGTRIKRDRSPVADAGWKAVVEGEKTIYINESVNPTEISIWTAVRVNSGISNVGEWVMTWSSKGNSSVPDDVAYTSKANMFVPFQKMGDSANHVFLTGARHGNNNPQGVVVPLAFGEIFIRQLINTNNYEFYIAAEEADVDSWIRIYDTVAITNLDTRVTNLENEDTAVNERITMLDADLDRFGITLGQIDSEITGIQSDITIHGQNIGILDGRIGTCETKNLEQDGRIAALETHVPTIESHATQLGLVNPKLNGVSTGVTLVSPRSIGADLNVTSVNVSQDAFCSAPVVFVQPDVGTTRTVSMGDIIPFDSPTLTSTQVREGSRIRIVNKGAGTVRLSSPSGVTIFADLTTLTTFDIPAYCSVEVFALIHTNGNKMYITGDISFVNVQPASKPELVALTTRVEISEGAITSLGTRLGRVESTVGTVDSDMQTVKSDISGLRSRVTTAESLIASDGTEIDNLKTTIGSSDTSAGSLRKRIKDLETQVAALKTWTLVSNGHL